MSCLPALEADGAVGEVSGTSALPEALEHAAIARTAAMT
jgi:hypothetical protein